MATVRIEAQRQGRQRGAEAEVQVWQAIKAVTQPPAEQREQQLVLWHVKERLNKEHGGRKNKARPGTLYSGPFLLVLASMCAAWCRGF